MYSYLIFVLFLISSGQGHQAPCKEDDDKCILELAKTAYNKVIKGIPSIGVESSDPMWVNEIDGSLSILHYKLNNCSVTGFAECHINYFKLDLKNLNMKVNLICPHLLLNCDYKMNGRLIVLPVEGNGKLTIDSKSYDISLDASLTTPKGENGAEYLDIKNHKITQLQPTEGITFTMTNLFNGRQDLSNTVHKFANENWMEVAHEFGTPIFKVQLKYIIKQFNKYLKTVALRNYIVN